MTDSEIIKALRKEIELIDYVNGFSADNVSRELLQNTLELISRKKTEIKKLKNRLRDDVKKSRNKALKEFADELIASCYGVHDRGFVCEGDIKDVLKEMTEGE